MHAQQGVETIECLVPLSVGLAHAKKGKKNAFGRARLVYELYLLHRSLGMETASFSLKSKESSFSQCC